MKKSILLFSFLSCAFGVFAQPIDGITNVCVGSMTSLSDVTSGGTWTSASPSIATVGSATGNVSGVSAGTSVITYNFSGGGMVTTVVTVNPLPAAISGTGNICAGGTTTFSDATTGGAWSSSNNFVAMVDDVSGVSTAISEDTATIFYTLPTGCSRWTGVTVNAMPIAIIGASHYCVGVTDTLYDSGAGTWSTSTPSVISIGAVAGNITGLAAGTANITYTLPSGCAVYLTATISPMPNAGTVAASDNVCIGASTTCTSDACCGIWSSSDLFLATVGSVSGIVTGVGEGTVTINYKVTNICGTVTAVAGMDVLSSADCTKLSVKKAEMVITKLSVIPNPASGGNFTVTLNSGKDEQANIVITSVLGEKVKEFTTTTNKKNEVKIDSAAGIYNISATTGTGKYDSKIIVE